MMIKTKQIALASLCVTLMMSSCLFDKNRPKNEMTSIGIVTVKTEPTKKVVYLQLDEKTTLLPTNIKAHPFKNKEVRAVVNYKEDKKAPHDGFTKAVYVNWIKDILTKEMVQSTDKNDLKYGNDPIGLIKNDCLVEDGYLTLNFAARYGDAKKPHSINLLYGVDPQDPYTLELRHDVKEDKNGRMVAKNLVAFSLKQLPSTKGEKKVLKIRFRTETGSQTIELDYISGKKEEPKH